MVKVKPLKVSDKPPKSTLTKTIKKRARNSPKIPAPPKAPLDLETAFEISRKAIRAAVEGVIKLRRENPKLKNRILDESFNLHLQIGCFKLPKTSFHKLLRVPLRHSIFGKDSEICLVVADLKDIPRKEHDTHIEYYEKLLENKGVQGIKKIMTFHELKTEHATYEQKIRLANTYDHFLSAGTIHPRVYKHCGKIFIKRHKIATPVKMQATKLKEHFEDSLRKTMLHLQVDGNCHSVTFGSSEMNIEKLIDNVVSVLEFLNEKYPGGKRNISGIFVEASRATSIPIYVSGKSPNEVAIPKIEQNLPKAYKTYQDELSTTVNAAVVVKPTGDVKVIRKRGRFDENGDEITSHKKKDKKKKKRKNKGKIVEETNEDVENDDKLKTKEKKAESKGQKTKKNKKGQSA